MSGCWTDDEAGWKGAKFELARIRRRFRAHWFKSLLITLAFTSLIVLSKARKQRVFEATVVYRVTEGDFDSTTAPPTAAKLREHVAEVSLSGQRLVQVMQKFNIETTMLKADRLTALDTMRDLIDIQVLRNYFSQQRYPEDPPRSARIAISFRSADPTKALEVARYLGELVAEQEMEDRKRVALDATEAASSAASELRNQVMSLRAEQARQQVLVATGTAAERAFGIMKLRYLARSIRDLEDELRVAEARSTDLELRNAFEGQQMGLRFELIDPGRPPRVLLTHGGYLTLVGVIVFFFLAPVVAIGVGAFDVRLYDEEDVRRLGIEPFGAIPCRDNRQMGALRARLKADTGATCKT